MSKLAELQSVVDQIRSEVKVDKLGSGFLSARALSRICDIHHSTLQTHFSGGQNGVNNPSKLAQILIDHDFEPWRFSETGIPDIAAYLVIDYYAYNAGKNCTEFAKIAQKAIGAIGMRQWCREVTGWSGETVVTDTTTIESMFTTMMTKLDKELENNRQLFMNEIKEIKEEKAKLEEFKDDVENYVEFSRLLDVAKNEVDEDEYPDGVTCAEYVHQNAIPLHDNAFCTLSRRTASYYRSTKGVNPAKRYGKNIYYGKEVAYIVTTIQMLMRGL